MFNLFGKSKNENVTSEDNSGKVIKVDLYRCPQNHRCPSIRVCPVGALSQDRYEAPKVDMDKCIKCGKCIKFCPMRSLYFK